MGLDMYAYIATKAGQQSEFYEGCTVDEDTGDFVNKAVSKPRELAYWRKHPNLHGWMEQLWLAKGKPGIDLDDERDFSFNGIELEVTAGDLDDLEQAVTHGQLPATGGFFFGENSDDHYRIKDLEFIRNARTEIFMGLKVFYNSSW